MLDIHALNKLCAARVAPGWCASCKSSYQKLCKIVADKALRKSFTFAKANIEVPEIKAMLKEENIMGIPYMLVYDKQVMHVPHLGGPTWVQSAAVVQASQRQLHAAPHVWMEAMQPRPCSRACLQP